MNNKDNKVSNMDKIEFKYAENYKNILDLYMDNSVSEKGLLGSVDVATSMAEFALGQCAMVQNGNWAWSQISEVDGNTVKAEDIKFMPIYFGVDDEKTKAYVQVQRTSGASTARRPKKTFRQQKTS